MLITDEMKKAFKFAQELEQTVKLRNVVLCRGNTIWVVNLDRTLILCFSLVSKTSLFPKDILFYSNEYEAENFITEEDGTASFISTEGEYTRKKKNSAVFNLKDIDIQKLWTDLMIDKKKATATFTLNDKLIPLFRDVLPHIEFSSQEKQLIIKQKDYYGGAEITVEKNVNSVRKLLTDPMNLIKEDLQPIALRTIDLLSLLSIEKNITFYLDNKSPGRCLFESKGLLRGLISWCVYDELGHIEYIGEVHKPEKKGTILKKRTVKPSKLKKKEGSTLGVKANLPKNMDKLVKKKPKKEKKVKVKAVKTTKVKKEVVKK